MSADRSARRLLPLAALLCLVFIALGTWQVERRAWKLDLIARVDQRVRAEPAAPPGPRDWPRVDAAHDEYRRVRLDGRFLDDRPTFVQAVTDLGAGYWVISALRQDDGEVVLVNRGFVDPEARATVAPALGPATVVGLLRLTEPGGGFLRHNDPAANRWYSRDVAAIAAARGLARVAPYFVDAQQVTAPPAAGTVPVPGLTVIAFHNSHLVYALTWYTLAAMSAGAAWRSMRGERRGQD